MNRRFLLRPHFDHTFLAALNVLVIAGGAAALYHWLSFAEMAPATMLCTAADTTVQRPPVNCPGGAQVATSGVHAGG